MFYHDIRLNVDIARDFSFSFGVDNLFNRNPPLGLTGLGPALLATGDSSIYSVRGRNFYAGFRARF